MKRKNKTKKEGKQMQERNEHTRKRGSPIACNQKRKKNTKSCTASTRSGMEWTKFHEWGKQSIIGRVCYVHVYVVQSVTNNVHKGNKKRRDKYTCNQCVRYTRHRRIKRIGRKSIEKKNTEKEAEEKSALLNTNVTNNDHDVEVCI